ncbi:uncharacterized protein [Centruroides vittatus]|uniref:uncharacterized protein n=1 Tax=Centruroides vittatus TaxID=120091 RepID=UPI0035107F0B
MGFWNSIIIVSILIGVSGEINVSYQELVSLNADCYPFDTCNTTESIPASSRSCQCDDSCAFYRDCCLDASCRRTTGKIQTHNYECLQVDEFEAYFVVSTCKSKRADSATKRRCEEDLTAEDPYTLIPVMSRRSKTVYRNRYCASCNEDSKYLNFWSVGVTCSRWYNDIIDDIQHNLVYNFKLRSWGIRLPNRTFVDCIMNAVVPENKQFLRPCYPDMISACPSKWKDYSTRKKCNSYTAVIYGYDGIYRNVHCAICNGIDTERYHCRMPFRTVPVWVFRTYSMSRMIRAKRERFGTNPSKNVGSLLAAYLFSNL